MSSEPHSTAGRGGPGGWIRLGAIVALVAGSMVLFRTSGIAEHITIGQIRAARASAGALAPLLYVLLYVVGTVLAFPGLLITFVGGLLFGTWYGGILVTIGAWIGAMLAFQVARRIGRAPIERFVSGGRLERFDRALTGSGFSAVVFTRLVPIVPFNIVNYVWGLSGVSFRSYAVATLVAMIPAEFVFTNLGGAVARTLEGQEDATLASIDYSSLLNRDVATAFALLGLMALIPTLVNVVRARRAAERAQAEETRRSSRQAGESP